MSDRSLVASHREAGRLELTRVGVRRAERVGSSGAEAPRTTVAFVAAEASDQPQGYRVGDLELLVESRSMADLATLRWRVANRGLEVVQVESVVLGFRWTRRGSDPLRFLRHGWQSWSFTGARDLDDAGEPAFPSGEWLRGMHHAVGAPPPDRSGWHESDIVSVAGEASGASCLVGLRETGGGFGTLYLRPAGPHCVDIEVEVQLEVPFEPGHERDLEAVDVALGVDASALLEAFAERWGRDAGARTGAPFQAGWCSWYHFFHDVTESDLLRNLEVLAAERSDFPVDVVQLDDGYQRQIGDWLETNQKFPRGLAPIAEAIRAAGFTPGLWTAPFCAVPESRIAQEHPEWLLRNGSELFLGLLHAEWTPTGRVHALDTTRQAVLDHLESLYRELAGLGFCYLKLDFLHAVAMRADAHDSGVTRAERLRDGLRAVRRGAGEEAFLLGCGCPLGPAVGIVDGMRIGPDVAPSWKADAPVIIPGLEPALPSLESALRSVLHRVWMHRRLWLNDPDCLMARTQDTALEPEEVRTLAATVGATGGMLVISDDLPSVSEAGRRWVRETSRLARAVDGADRRGTARCENLLAPHGPSTTKASLGLDTLVAATNGTDEPVDAHFSFARRADSRVEALLGSAAPDARDNTRLAPHATSLCRIQAAHDLAVFCDFDGTFSVQDVGSTLAKQRLPEKREDLWARYELGEFTPWEYTCELLDGFALPEVELEEFLHTIELDPGARSLIQWCARQSARFHVLSDGFNYNLERLQSIHGVSFEYDANRLRYVDGRWSISPGAPNPACVCGTGTCKRGQIEEWRRKHPEALCIHIGNGRVSDLCGALAADRTYAKDTLAPALAERGAAYQPFDTLLDVVRDLDQWIGAGRDSAPSD